MLFIGVVSSVWLPGLMIHWQSANNVLRNYCDHFFFIIAVTEVHCDIYQSSYNISPWVHPIHHSPLSSYSWNSFNSSHFSSFIHEYIIYPPYSPSYTLSWYLSPCDHFLNIFFKVGNEGYPYFVGLSNFPPPPCHVIFIMTYKTATLWHIKKTKKG
jgi:hypothetical protein